MLMPLVLFRFFVIRVLNSNNGSDDSQTCNDTQNDEHAQLLVIWNSESTYLFQVLLPAFIDLQILLDLQLSWPAITYRRYKNQSRFT